MEKLYILLILFLQLLTACKDEPVYTAEYKQAVTGKASFEIPEVLELTQIAVSLTNYNDKNRTGQYWKDVDTYFSKYKTHPLIAELKSQIINFNADYDLRMGAFAHEFDANGNIVTGLYPFSKFGDGKNRFPKLKAQFEDFAKQSDFRAFYKNQKINYDFQIKKQAELMPMRQMWDWLEQRFDDRSQSYKVIFSPLFGGNHNTVWFETKGFRESIFFISYVGNDFQTQNQKIREGLASRIVFTEIDHNYVNPVSEKCKRQINKTFKDWEKWNTGSQGYKSAILTFNEYMTWAVFTLYAYDTFEKNDFEKINQETENFIVNQRGFKKFKAFNQYLLSEYQKTGQ